MRSIALLCLCAAMLPAQSGDYRFVQLFVRDSPARQAKNAGGTISFDGAGGFRLDARIGVNQEASRELRSSGSYRLVPEAGLIEIPNPAQPDLTLRLRLGPDADVLLGSSVDEGQAVYDLFVAIRAPSRPVSNRTVAGAYGAAYFLVYNGMGAGISTALLDFTADGRGAIPSAVLIGHAAGIDDSNRREKFAATTYAIRSDGSGGLAIHESSDILFGDKEIFISEDGSLMLGYSTAEGARDIFIAVRKDPDTATFSFSGGFWISELMAENDFEFRPETARFSSASGSLQAANGAATLYERVNQNGRRVHLTTVNSYLIGSDGRNVFGPRYRQGLHNFALGANGAVFLGAQVGIAGELTLDHGIFFGLRIPEPNSAGLHLALPSAPIAPGAIITLHGAGFSSAVEVLVDGEPAVVLKATADQIEFQAPTVLSAPTASVAIRIDGRLSNSIRMSVSLTAPVLISAHHANFTPIAPDSPAQPGETIILLATGLGATGPDLRLYFEGRPADLLFAGPMPGFPGFYQLNVTIPEGITTAPVALATTDAFLDLATLPLGQ